MTLCTRCALLFKECRPLAGVACPAAAPANPLPFTPLKPQTHAAVIQDHRTGRAHISTILILDFYAGWP